MTYEQRSVFACKVCGNVPDEDGLLEHGKGCFVVDSDGGGQEYVEFPKEIVEPKTPDSN